MIYSIFDNFYSVFCCQFSEIISCGVYLVNCFYWRGWDLSFVEDLFNLVVRWMNFVNKE